MAEFAAVAVLVVVERGEEGEGIMVREVVESGSWSS